VTSGLGYGAITFFAFREQTDIFPFFALFAHGVILLLWHTTIFQAMNGI
jgi:hypothetical protein